MTSSKPIAYLCQCAQDTSKLELLLHLSGFEIRSNLSLPSIVRLISDSGGEMADLIVSCVQEGGLAVAQMIGQIDAATQPMVALIDRTGDVPSAIKAVRMRVADYLLLREGDDLLVARFSMLAKRLIERMPQIEDAAFDDSAVAHAGRSQYSHSAHHNVWWDSSLCAIRSDEMWVPLSPIEWKLFETLVGKRGSVVSTEDLILTALSRTGTTAADTSLLRLHVSRLRAKLNEHFSQELSIVTMRGRGYMLV